jgi:hypothetical protein
VSRIIPIDQILSHREMKWQQILNKLTDDRLVIEEMLSAKITFENDALARCRHYCSTHRIGNFIRPIAAEFQFDRKKLTIFVMKAGDASVCKLVRKLFDSFKIRISILDIESPELARHYAMKYLNLSKISLPLDAVYLDPAIIPYVPPTQQLGKSKAASLQQSLSQYSSENLHHRLGRGYGGDSYHHSSSSASAHPTTGAVSYYPTQTTAYADPRYDNMRLKERIYSAQSTSSASRYHPVSAAPYQQRPVYYPTDMFPRYSPSPSHTGEDGGYYSNHHDSPVFREGIGNYPDDYYHETDFTLAEHQELSKYFQGNEKYPLEADLLYRTYAREADALPSALDPRHTPLDFEDILFTHPNDEGFPLPLAPALSSQLPHTSSNEATRGKIDDRFGPFEKSHKSQSTEKTNHPNLYLRGADSSLAASPVAVASMLKRHSYTAPYPSTSMNRSAMTYPIEQPTQHHAYLNYSTEHSQFCENEDHDIPYLAHSAPSASLSSSSTVGKGLVPIDRHLPPPLQTALPRPNVLLGSYSTPDDGDLTFSPTSSSFLPRASSATLFSDTTTPSSTSSFTSSF